MNTKTLLKALGFAILTLIIVNIIYFMIALKNTELLNNWNIVFKHGTFRINEQITGLKLFSSKANGIMLVVFISVLLSEYKKGNLKLKRN